MKTSKFKTINLIIMITCFLCLAFAAQVSAEPRRSAGGTLYISVYPKIMSADGKKIKFYLTNILTVRNLDLLHPITVESIAYHDNSGSAQRHLLKEPLVLNPLSSHTLRVEGKDLESSGMAGCYILSWKALQEVSAPLAEMLIGYGGSGISYSFVLQGVPIKD
jgi:hypothetical protein